MEKISDLKKTSLYSNSVSTVVITCVDTKPPQRLHRGHISLQRHYLRYRLKTRQNEF